MIKFNCDKCGKSVKEFHDITPVYWKNYVLCSKCDYKLRKVLTLTLKDFFANNDKEKEDKI